MIQFLENSPKIKKYYELLKQLSNKNLILNSFIGWDVIILRRESNHGLLASDSVPCIKKRMRPIGGRYKALLGQMESV